MLALYLAMAESEAGKNLVEKIYYNYRKLMYSVSYSILHDAADAEDAVHEAFLRIIRNISKISEPDSGRTRAFAVVVVKNVALDMLKKKSRTEVPLPEEDVFSDGGGIPDLGVEVLKDTLMRLPDAYYEIILLKVFYGCGTDSLASLLGISRESAKTRLRRARQRLRKILEEVGYEQSL